MAQPRGYVPVPLAQEQEVAAALGRSGRVQRLQEEDPTSPVFLRMDADDGSTWFVKVVESGRVEQLLDAESLAGWLRDQGVRVIAAHSSANLSQGRRLWAYAYHHGSPPEARPEDMDAIGRELGRLHQALGRHPSLPEWRMRTASRLARLTAVRQALAGGTLAAGPDPALLQSIAADDTIDFLPSGQGAAEDCLAIHGDLHRFNMLMDEQGCTFLDFEDVPHSALPPIFDLATVSERVASVGQPPEAALSLVVALFDAYATVTGHRPDMKQLPDVLRGLALRSLCTLAHIDPAGRDPQEWQKFFFLLSEAQARRPMFQQAGPGS